MKNQQLANETEKNQKKELTKKIVIIVFSVFSVGLLSGCGKVTPNVSTDSKSMLSENKKQEELTIDTAIEKFKSAGFTLGQKEETYYQMLGAYDGAKIDVDNFKVEIYQYKDAQKDAKKNAKETLETASSIIFEYSSLLIILHSKDTEFANRLETALKN